MDSASARKQFYAAERARMVARLVGPGFGRRVHEIGLVDYAEALEAPPPSWLAGALVTVQRRRPTP